MATSAAQIAANRGNAKRSTGPRTEEGKHASSSNSITTGLTATKIFFRPDEQSDFMELQSDLLEAFKPDGTPQTHFFDLLLHAAWNIRRCFLLESRIQDEALAKGLDDALLDNELSVKLDRVYRYKKMHESTHRRAMAGLRELQTEEVWRRDKGQFQDESILVDTTKVQLKACQSDSIQERTKLDVLRQQIESFIAPPSLPHQRR
jgi:hypothetical protein